MFQRLEFCIGHVNAQLMVLADGKFVTLVIFGKLLHDMLGVTSDFDVTEEGFLSLPKLKEATYNEKDIITKLVSKHMEALSLTPTTQTWRGEM